MNYLLLPGNPPAAHFYELWAREIQAQHPEARVKVSHYPDMEYSSDSNQAMQDVLNAHLEQLEVFYKISGAPVTLVGHSLGAYFALGLASKAPELIEKCILVHPFLRAPSLLGLVTLNAAGSLYRSNRFQKAFLYSKKGLGLAFKDLAHVSNEEVLRSFHLARHESQTIGKDYSRIEIKAHLRKKIKVFYNLKDIWCTDRLVADLKQQVLVQKCTEPHGFVTKAEHRASLFNRF